MGNFGKKLTFTNIKLTAPLLSNFFAVYDLILNVDYKYFLRFEEVKNEMCDLTFKFLTSLCFVRSFDVAKV